MKSSIHIQGIGKQYQLGAKNPLSNNIREDLTRWIRSRFSSAPSSLQKSNKDFWALQEINLEVKSGEVLGIVGRNGAGKSTLLKILSRITPPTTGEIQYKGRVASLLEVGTGFHRELTGRENIFLNGTILGMRRAEIVKKLDEIVAFAEVEQFLDTPVKHYSSGMYVRLAFAVAAHLDADIMLVDEILAVGDVAFQKKCLGKMGTIARDGRIVLFVSHSMKTVAELCNRAVYLKQGRLIADSDPSTIISQYLGDTLQGGVPILLGTRTDRRGSGRIRMTDFWIENEKGERVESLQSGKSYLFRLRVKPETHQTALSNILFSMDITDEQSAVVLHMRTDYTHQNMVVGGEQIIGCRVEDFPLTVGTYSMNLFMSIAQAEILDWVTDAAPILVDGGDFFGTGSCGEPKICKVLTHADWSSKSS